MSDKITWTNERRKLSQLIPWPRNPRQIKTDQAKRLVESFDQFGQVETIAIGPDNGVYNGHQRLNVLVQKYGQDYEVEVRVASRPLDEKEREKLTIFLHKGAAGEWDWDGLANNFEIPDLLDWGFSEKELQLGGFDLNAPEGDDPGAQMDKAEELREKWGVKTGDLWRLGEHRLICGDCTDRTTVERVMEGEKADLCLTDPPYGIGEKFGDYEDTPDNLEKLIDGFLPIAKELSQRVLLTPGNSHMFLYPKPTWVLSWFVSAGTGINPWGFTCWNAIFAYGSDPYLKAGKGSRPDAMVKSEASEKLDHPTAKPLGVWEWVLERGSIHQNEIIYEPFLGSGTTLIACERLHRKCRAVEISPAYCAVAIQRWVDMTGGTPELLDSLEVVQNGTA